MEKLCQRCNKKLDTKQMLICTSCFKKIADKSGVKIPKITGV